MSVQRLGNSSQRAEHLLYTETGGQTTLMDRAQPGQPYFLMRTAAIVDRYATFDVEAVDSPPGQFGGYMRSELVKWGDITKR
jgi:hypothetical protein